MAAVAEREGQPRGNSSFLVAFALDGIWHLHLTKNKTTTSGNAWMTAVLDPDKKGRILFDLMIRVVLPVFFFL